MTKAIHFALFLAAGAGFLSAPAHAGKVLVLPLNIDTTRIHDHKVVQDFFYEAVELENKGDAVRSQDSSCYEKACAIEQAKAAQAEQVVFGTVRFLGRKCFFTGSIVGADGSNFFSQTINVLGVADFENANKRMAGSLLRREVIEKTAAIDNITEREEVLAANSTRRRSFYSMGGSIGYLYPINGSFRSWESYDYWDCTLRDPNGNCPDRERKYSQMILMSWDNWFEFRSNLAMTMNVQWALPMAFGADLNLNYLFGKSDFTPFAGGGLGIHYVAADEGDHEDKSKRNSGPTLNFEGGMIFFRTFNVNMVAKATYQMILNDDYDQGAGVLLGVRTKF